MAHTQRLSFSGSSVEELEGKIPAGLTLLEGSTGRIELTGERVLGICFPVGTAMATPLAGSTWANALAPSGAVVTDRNGFGNVCNAWVDFAVPVTEAQTMTTTMGLVVAVIAVAVAIGAALVALGWAVSEIRLTIDSVVEGVPGGGAGLGVLLWVGAALLAVVALERFQKTRRRA